MNKGIILDRDGTINVEVNYLHEPDKFKFERCVPESLYRLSKAGYTLFVAGIGNGYYSLQDMVDTNEHMCTLLRTYGISIRKIYFCPHKEINPIICNCRKPRPGMILQAIKEFDLDPTQTWMIGDRDTDMEAGRGAGVHTYKVGEGKTLWDAANFILGENLHVELDN